MYINNGQNILTISNLRLVEEYFKQICQTLDSLYHLLFGNQAPPPLFSPVPPLPLAFSSSRSSSGAIPHCLLSKIPDFTSSIPRLPIYTSCPTSSIPRLLIHVSQTKILKAPINVKPRFWAFKKAMFVNFGAKKSKTFMYLLASY